MRIVYHLFKHAFPFEDPEYSVLPINRNVLDIYPENLELVYTPGYQSRYFKYQGSGRPKRRIKVYKGFSFSKINLDYNAHVSCYSTEGKRLNTYRDIHQASQVTGLLESQIQEAINALFSLLSDCYWRNGIKARIDVSLIRFARQQIQKERTLENITQFDLSGMPISFYNSIQDAAKSNGIPEADLRKALDSDNNLAGFYLWRRGHWESPITGI